VRTTGEWRGTVSLIEERNYLTNSFRRFPLKTINFQGEDGEIMIYLTSSSPGLFNGDRQEISCRLTDDAHLFLTDASATELHPSLMKEECRQVQTFHLGKNSKFEYMPEPLIPFKGSSYNGKTSIYMTEEAQAIVGEIITAGRVGRNEIFEYQCFKSSFEVFWDNQLQVWDSIRLFPESNLKENGILGNFTHIGTLWILSEQISAEHLHHIQNAILPGIEQHNSYGGASLLQKRGIVIRVLGHASQVLQKFMKTCWDYFRQELFHLQPLEVLK
jgi:urease accessory protein